MSGDTIRGNGNLRENKKVLRNFRTKLVLGIVLPTESISGIRFAIRVILGELWVVYVVKITSAGFRESPVNKGS